MTFDPFQHFIVVVKGGLGNQLFQFAFAVAGSMVSGRPHVFDIRLCRQSDSRPYYLDRIDPQALVLDDERLRKLRAWVDPQQYRKRRLAAKALGLKRQVKWIVDAEQGYAAGVFSPLERALCVFDGYWQHEEYFKVCRDELLGRLRRFVADYCRVSCLEHDNIPLDRAVCIHVRRGDYLKVNEVRPVYAILDSTYYSRALEYFREQIPEPVACVFSDDYEWARRQLRLRCDTVFFDNSVSSDVKTATLDDFCRMAQFKNFIIANSTFSWWAAYVGSGGVDGRVVAPQQWYVAADKMKADPVPRSWRRL